MQDANQVPVAQASAPALTNEQIQQLLAQQQMLAQQNAQLMAALQNKPGINWFDPAQSREFLDSAGKVVGTVGNSVISGATAFVGGLFQGLAGQAQAKPQQAPQATVVHVPNPQLPG
jgi:hypothetical protein